MRIDKKLKRITSGMTNQEICQITKLKNYELSKIFQNSLEITEEIEGRLNKLEKREWSRDWLQYNQDLLHARMIYILWIIICIISLNPQMITFSILFIILIIEGLMFKSEFFHYIARCIKK